MYLMLRNMFENILNLIIHVKQSINLIIRTWHIANTSGIKT